MRMRNFGERALQPLDVPPLVDEAPAPHLADFIDAVGELIAAILDMDLGVAHRQIAAVDVGDAGHRGSATQDGATATDKKRWNRS